MLVARELYDLKMDPQENENIAELPGSREVVKGLASQLSAGWRAALPE